MRFVLCLILGVLLTVGCSPDGRSPSTRPNLGAIPPGSLDSDEPTEIPVTTLENGEPSHVTVQHILISFNGRMGSKPILRNADEAAKLAQLVLEKAKSGEDFDELVKKYTDDSYPGIYRLANHGQKAIPNHPDPAKVVMPREGVVPAFGDIGFTLQVGEIGMSEFDWDKSPFGWHIIKRLK
jgi:hypothetical protein